ncbi:hypothetical protein ACFWHW_29155 [Streptomyces pharetrae]|uniref:hypothetical protein n=1 Tax=Streptomyces pharetrae TaxID=291370 RepID=UPI003648FFB1
MLSAPGRRISSTSKAAVAVSVLLAGALSTSCGLVPEHPDDGNLVLGFRVTEGSVQVKIPICPGEYPNRVEVWDPGSDTRKERLLWWAEGPAGKDAADGLLKLWSPDDYRKSSPSDRPAEAPPLVDVSVSYAAEEDSVGDLVNLKEAAKRLPAEGLYWTARGETMSAQAIDEQLSCAEKPN